MILQQTNAILGIEESHFGKFSRSLLPHQPVDTYHASQHSVMKYDRLTTRRHLHIAFDGETGLDRGAEGRHRVFRPTGLRIVISAMRDGQAGQPVRRRRQFTHRRLFDLHDRIDLDCDATGQRGHADRRAGVFAGIAQHFDQQVGRAVDHLWLVGEIRR